MKQSIRELATVTMGVNKKQLETLLTKASDAYYGGKVLVVDPLKYPGIHLLAPFSRAGKVRITDSVYDLLEDALRKKFPKSGTLKTLYPKGTFTKSQKPLPFAMPSLSQVRPGEGNLQKWGKKYPGPYVLSHKLDGVSIEVIYKNGKPVQAFTKYSVGGGKIGQDISYLLPYLRDIPKSIGSGSIGVRGEIIMPRSKFNSMYAKTLKNARNMVSGLVNKKTLDPALGNTHVVMYELLQPRVKISKQLTMLKQLGFRVVEWEKITKLDEQKLAAGIDWIKKHSAYDVDGYVLTADDKAYRLSGGNPPYSVKFKKLDIAGAKKVVVTGVEWNLSKTGAEKPRINIKPVDLGGVTISWTSGFNAKYIKDNGIGKGAVLLLVRSGDVIPHIIKVIRKARSADLPTLKGLQWDKTHTNLVLPKQHAIHGRNSAVTANQINAFMHGLNVKYVGSSTILSMMDAGYGTITKLVKARLTDWRRVLGDTIGRKCYNSLHSSLKHATIPQVLAGYPLPRGGFGRERWEILLGDWPEFLVEAPKIPVGELQRDLEEIPQFGRLLSSTLAKEAKKIVSWYKKLGLRQLIYRQNTIRKVSSKLSNQKVIFTGFRDPLLENAVMKNGGTMVGAIGKATILVVKDQASNSSKAKFAKKSGIKILERKKFASLVGLN